MSTKKQPFEIKSIQIIESKQEIARHGSGASFVEISTIVDAETGVNYFLILTRCHRASSSDTTQFIPRLDANGNIMVTKKEDSVGS